MDKKAKTILFNTYWSGQGWKDERSTDPEEFAYAKAHGLMFDPVSFTHDECLVEVLALLERISPAKAAQAFVSSLSSRRLDWRSGVASYFIASHLISHSYTPVVSGTSYDNGEVIHTSHTCLTCRDSWHGLIGNASYQNVDLNVFNFERLKWGGVRHGKLDYIWFDLQQLERADISEPTAQDIETLQSILTTIALSQPDDHVGTLEKNLALAVKSSKNERRALIEILAHLAILSPASYDRPNHGKSDWSGAAACWRGADQYDRIAARKHFGSWLRLADA